MKVTKKLLSAVSTGILTFDADNWQENIQAIFTVNSTIQDNIQACVVYGFDHFNVNGSNNPDVFNYLLKLATGKYGTGLRSETLKKYICTLTSLSYKKIKGEHVFCKATKKSKVVTVPETLDQAWYLFDKKGVATVDMDFRAALEQLHQRFGKAFDGELDSDTRKVNIKNKDDGQDLMGKLETFLGSNPKVQAEPSF